MIILYSAGEGFGQANPATTNPPLLSDTQKNHLILFLNSL